LLNHQQFPLIQHLVLWVGIQADSGRQDGIFGSKRFYSTPVAEVFYKGKYKIDKTDHQVKKLIFFTYSQLPFPTMVDKLQSMFNLVMKFVAAHQHNCAFFRNNFFFKCGNSGKQVESRRLFLSKHESMLIA